MAGCCTAKARWERQSSLIMVNWGCEIGGWLQKEHHLLMAKSCEGTGQYRILMRRSSQLMCVKFEVAHLVGLKKRAHLTLLRMDNYM